MPLPRLHLVELEDLPWFPRAVRDLATDFLRHMEEAFGMHRPAVRLLHELMQHTGVRSIVDFGSGGGGSVPAVVRALRAAGVEVRATLTDLYPNRAAFAALAEASDGAIDFSPESVDARRPPPELRGIRTFFTVLHHFRPEEVRAMLRAATRAGDPVAVFEVPERRLAVTAGFLIAPLAVWLFTPFVRPMTFGRLLWTYPIPLVPFLVTWDGIVSHLRAYRPEELLSMAEEASGGGYVWRAGVERVPGQPLRVTWLVGWPAG